MSKATKTDWKRLESMPDSSIDTSEMPELGDDFFQRAELHTPPKQAVTMRLDADVLAWFKEKARGTRRGSTSFCAPTCWRSRSSTRKTTGRRLRADKPAQNRHLNPNRLRAAINATRLTTAAKIK